LSEQQDATPLRPAIRVSAITASKRAHGAGDAIVRQLQLHRHAASHAHRIAPLGLCIALLVACGGPQGDETDESLGQSTAGASAALLSSQVFDCAFYRGHYPDLAQRSCDALQDHWLGHGAAEGRQASPLFHSGEYLQMYPDLQRAFGPAGFQAAVMHYLRHGIGEGRAGRFALHHHVFDCDHYRHLNQRGSLSCPEAKREWLDLVVRSRHLEASPLFNVSDYFSLHADLRDAFGNNVGALIRHYVLHGMREEGRAPHRELQPRFFDCAHYAHYNRDLATFSCDALKRHFRSHGMREGRRAHAQFFIRDYLRARPVLEQRFGHNLALAWAYLINHELSSLGGSAGPYQYRELETGAFARTGRVFSATDYGADPSGARDSAGPIGKAIAAAALYTSSTGQFATVSLPAGTFRLRNCPHLAQTGGRTCLSVQHAQNVMIRGAGQATKLLMENVAVGLVEVSNATNVYLGGFALDYALLPFLQGRVASTQQRGDELDVVLQLSPGLRYAPLGEYARLVNGGFGIVYDPVRQWLRKRNTESHYFFTRLEAIDGGRVRLVARDAHAVATLKRDVAPGDPFVFTTRANSAITFSHSTNIGMHDVMIHAAPSAGTILYANSGEILIDRYVVRRASAKRILSTNSDGLHCQRNRTPITVQNSYFEGMGDDAINIYTIGHPVLVAAGGGTRGVVGPSGYTIRAGDTIQAVRPADSAVIGWAVVRSAARRADGSYELAFDRAISGLTGGAPPDPSRQFPNTLIYNASTASGSSKIVNNIFGPNRRSAILLKAPNSTVSDNRFLFTDVSAIMAHNIVRGFLEGPVPHGIAISRNRFHGGLSASPLVLVGTEGFGAQRAEHATGTRISNNYFVSCGAECIELAGAQATEIRHNVFDSASAGPRTDATQGERLIIKLGSQHNTDIAHNAFWDFRPSTVRAH
jgi:hypothetical protein